MNDVADVPLAALLRAVGDPSGASEANELWSEIVRRIHRIARVMLADFADRRVDPEDVAQMIVTRLYGTPDMLARVAAAASPAAYLGRMARNEAITRMRSLGREAETTMNLASVFEPGSEADRSIDLTAALATLTEEERRLLAWRFVDGLSIRDISQRLGISYSATATRMFRIMDKLRQKRGL